MTRKSIPFTLESDNSSKGSPKIEPISTRNSYLERFSNPLPVMFSGTEEEQEQPIG